MKNLYAIALTFFFCAAGFAQQVPDLGMQAHGNFFHSPQQVQRPPFSSAQSVNSFYIDYDSADAALYGPGAYKRYVWPMNEYYTTADSSIIRCTVVFDSLYDAYNGTGYNRDSVNNLAVDSIFLMLGQENNSGVDDTLLVKIIAVDSVHGYPLPSSVYWANTIIIPPASLSSDWRSPVAVKMVPYVSIPTNRFAISVDYFGSKLDTLGIVAGFGYRDTCGTLNNPADTTHFSPIRKLSSGDKFKANSFALWSQYQFIGLLPTQNGSNIYFDCNNNGQYDGGLDGESYIQNVQFIAHVKTNAAGIHERNPLGLSVTQNVPNPFENSSEIRYSLEHAGEVSLDVFDLSGKKIASLVQGRQLQGAHVVRFDGSLLEPGMYFYTITAGGARITRKMTVMR